MEEMKWMLKVWIDHLSTRNIPLSSIVIQEKARHIHGDFVAKHVESSREKAFLASKGWFDSFKKRHSMHSLKIIQSGDYISQQMYNVDETELF